MRSNYRIVLLGLLTSSLASGYGALFTVAADYRDEYGLSESAIGILIGLGFIAALIAELTIAPLADRGHATLLIGLGVVSAVTGAVILGFGETLPVLLSGRFLSGFGIGAATPAIRRQAILIDDSDIGRNLGTLVSFDVFGFALGPVLSTLLVGSYGLAAPFLVVATVTAAAGLLNIAFFKLQRTNDTGGDKPDPPERIGSGWSVAATAATLMGAAAFVQIGTFDALWDVAHADLGTPSWMANLGITLFAVPLMLLGPFGGRMAQRRGPFLVSGIGLTIGALFMLSYGMWPSGSLLFGASLFHAVSDGLTVAAPGVALAIATPQDQQATAQGRMGAAQTLAAGLSATVVGFTYDGAGRFAAYTLAAALIMVLALAGLAFRSVDTR